MTVSFSLQVELTGSSVFDYVHPGDHVEMAEQLGMKLPPGRGISLSQGAVNEDGASSASSSSHSETPEPGEKRGRRAAGVFLPTGETTERRRDTRRIWSRVALWVFVFLFLSLYNLSRMLC